MRNNNRNNNINYGENASNIVQGVSEGFEELQKWFREVVWSVLNFWLFFKSTFIDDEEGWKFLYTRICGGEIASSTNRNDVFIKDFMEHPFSPLDFSSLYSKAFLHCGILPSKIKMEKSLCYNLYVLDSIGGCKIEGVFSMIKSCFPSFSSPSSYCKDLREIFITFYREVKTYFKYILPLYKKMVEYKADILMQSKILSDGDSDDLEKILYYMVTNNQIKLITNIGRKSSAELTAFDKCGNVKEAMKLVEKGREIFEQIESYLMVAESEEFSAESKITAIKQLNSFLPSVTKLKNDLNSFLENMLLTNPNLSCNYKIYWLIKKLYDESGGLILDFATFFSLLPEDLRKKYTPYYIHFKNGMLPLKPSIFSMKVGGVPISPANNVKYGYYLIKSLLQNSYWETFYNIGYYTLLGYANFVIEKCTMKKGEGAQLLDEAYFKCISDVKDLKKCLRELLESRGLAFVSQLVEEFLSILGVESIPVYEIESVMEKISKKIKSLKEEGKLKYTDILPALKECCQSVDSPCNQIVNFLPTKEKFTLYCPSTLTSLGRCPATRRGECRFCRDDGGESGETLDCTCDTTGGNGRACSKAVNGAIIIFNNLGRNPSNFCVNGADYLEKCLKEVEICKVEVRVCNGELNVQDFYLPFDFEKEANLFLRIIS